MLRTRAIAGYFLLPNFGIFHFTLSFSLSLKYSLLLLHPNLYSFKSKSFHYRCRFDNTHHLITKTNLFLHLKILLWMLQPFLYNSFSLFISPPLFPSVSNTPSPLAPVFSLQYPP
jgi:hypothetical protein